MIKLTQKDKQLLLDLHQSTRDKRVTDRIKIIIALSDGVSPELLSQIFFTSARTIQRIKMAFSEHGCNGLLVGEYDSNNYKLTEDQENELDALLDDNLYHTANEIIALVKKLFNIEYTTGGMVKLLNRLDFTYKKTKHIPSKADPEKQIEFINTYCEIREMMTDDEVLLFLDGTHPSHNSKLGYAWIKKGKTKYIKSNTGRQRLNINGAYDIDNHELTFCLDDTINAESVIKLLKLIEEKYKHKIKIIIVCDNARYYYSKMVRDYIDKSSKLKIIYLPPYSPNLNLIERLWKFMKEKVMNNKYYETFSEFKYTILDFLNFRLKQLKSELRKRMTENFNLLDST